MKALIQSYARNYNGWGALSSTFDATFIAPLKGYGSVEVSFTNSQEAIFADLQSDDEIELEVIIRRKPKTTTLTAKFS